MALSKAKKEQVVAEISQLLGDSRLTVIAKYQGTPVKALQQLRRNGRANGTVLKVVKNRLVIKALGDQDKFSQLDTNILNGMLLYAFNTQDEVAPAQVLAKFAKQQPTLEFVGGITAEGQFIQAADVSALASLPSKEQLRGQLVGTLAAPLSGFVRVMSANLRSVLNVMGARADSIQ